MRNSTESGFTAGVIPCPKLKICPGELPYELRILDVSFSIISFEQSKTDAVSYTHLTLPTKA